MAEDIVRVGLADRDVADGVEAALARAAAAVPMQEVEVKVKTGVAGTSSRREKRAAEPSTPAI